MEQRMEHYVGVICNGCGKKFLRKKSKWVLSQKRNTAMFCDKSCTAKYRHKVGSLDGKKNYEAYLRHRGTYSSNKLDELSPFKQHLKTIRRNINRKAKDRNISCNITAEDLKNQWEKQNGICPYTGLKMENCESTYKLSSFSPCKASVDRVDSSGGYELDNIEFVSLMAQYGKNRFSKEEFIEFCKQVATNHQ